MCTPGISQARLASATVRQTQRRYLRPGWPECRNCRCARTGTRGSSCCGHLGACSARRGRPVTGRRAARMEPASPTRGLRQMTFDVRRIRAAYPALADGYAYLDGAAGTQVPAAVVGAIRGAYEAGLSNGDGAFPASARADAITAACREAVADLVGGEPAGVVLGPNMTTLTYRIAVALAKTWQPGDEVIVSRLDHDANVRPWIQ